MRRMGFRVASPYLGVSVQGHLVLVQELFTLCFACMYHSNIPWK